MTERCDTCRWWDPTPGTTYGNCHGAPPTPVSGALAQWGVTRDCDGCAAWKKITPQKDPS